MSRAPEKPALLPFVSAQTITDITSSPVFAGREVPPAPPIEERLAQVRADLALRVEAAEKKQAGASGPVQARKFTREAARARNAQARFERLLETVPQGYRLAMVWHAPLDGFKTDVTLMQVRREFKKIVDRHFLQRVAAEAPQDAAAIGIGAHGLSQMRRRIEPCNKANHPFAVEINHTLEMEDAGALTFTKGIDPDDPGAGPKFIVNFESNLELVTAQLHGYINEFKRAVLTGKGAHRTAQWMPMPVREEGEGRSRLVCPPQPGGHPLAGLKLRPYTPVLGFRLAVHGIRQMGDAIYALRENALAPAALDLSRRIAANENMTVAELVSRQSYDPEERRTTLAALFNFIAAYDPALQEQVDRNIRPTLKDLTAQLARSFNETSQDLHIPKNARIHAKFARFHGTRAIRNLRNTVGGLPFPEAAELREKLVEIDAGLEAIRAARKADSKKPSRAKRRQARRGGP